MKSSEPSEEPSSFEKYRNLRRLNSNRAQKLSYLIKSKFVADDSSNFGEFLDYLDLVPSERAAKRPVPIPPIDTADLTDTQLNTAEPKSKIELLLAKKTRPKSVPNETRPPTSNKKISRCIFDYLKTIGGNHTPNDSFVHVQNHLKLIETKKCALVYDKFYCLVKIKKILENLYCLNFVKMGDSDPNESTDSAASLGQDLASVQIYFSDGECSQALMASLKKIDWCKTHNLTLKKPELGVEDTGLASLVAKLALTGRDTSQFESLFAANKDKKLVEIVDRNSVRLGRVLENNAGRYKIGVMGGQDVQFYFESDVYLKSFGWSKKFGIECANSGLLADKERRWLDGVEAGRADVMDQELPVRKNHLLEVLHENRFYIGCVSQVCNNELVRVRLDSGDPDIDGRELSFLVDFKNKSKSSDLLYPCKWCERNNLVLAEPSGWLPGQKFDWEVYTKNKCKDAQFYMSRHNAGFLSPRNASNSLADNFKIGQYLEVALDKNDQWLHLAKIKALLGNLLFVKVYSKNILSKNKLYIFTSGSCDLYPVGWSQINNYRFFDNSFFTCLDRDNDVRLDQMECHASFLQFVQSKLSISLTKKLKQKYIGL